MGNYYRGIDSEEYWRERAIDRDNAARKSENQIIREMNQLYRNSFMDIKREFNNWFNTYASDNNLTFAEAQRTLTPMELRQYKEHLATLKRIYNASHNPHVKVQMAKLGARANVTRYIALIDSIDKILIETSNNIQISMEEHLAGMYQREYQGTMAALGIEGAVIPDRAIKEIIEYPYAGAMFSDRIWRNKDQLLNYINNDLAKGLIKGDSIQRMSADLMNRCNVLYYQASRLVRTETNYVMNQGHKNGYKDAGITHFKFLSYLDHRTSPQCTELDGQVVAIEDAQVGTNMPPMHPNCRSTIIPIIIKAETPVSIDNQSEDLTFKDTKEAAAYLKDNYGFEKVSFGTKTSLDMAISLVNNTKKVYDRYPELKGFVRKFESGAMKNTYAYFKYGYDKNGNVLTLKTSSTLMDTVEKAKHHYDKDISKGFHPKGTTYNDIIVHEMGHAIDAYITAKRAGITNIKHDKISKEEMKILYQSYSSSPASTDIINQAFNNLGIAEIKDKAATIKNLSRYALQSRKETLAEAFADAMANGDNAQPLSKEILKLIDKEMNK